jgi:non-homologous end joining protein Ku
VAGSDIDPVYFDSPYYVYPDGPIAVEALRVIGAAMARAGVVSGALPSAGASGWSW